MKLPDFLIGKRLEDLGVYLRDHLLSVELWQATPDLHILGAVLRERRYQDSTHGSPGIHPHTPREWLAIMRAKLEDAESAWMHQNDRAMMNELLKVVSVGWAAMQQCGAVERQQFAQVEDKVVAVEPDSETPKKFVRLKLEGGGSYIIPLSELHVFEGELAEGEVGDKWTAELLTLTKDEYEALPEFAGH
jgi:hypothetical protein